VGAPPPGFSPALALRVAFHAGYSAADLRADLLAGVVVGVVALPLAMALAIASGVAPQHGLYTSIVAGAVIALLGGSKVQVSGPTAAFVAVLAPIAVRFGLGGLLVATLMAGVLLVGMGLARLGRLIQFVPYPVTAGFTAGIGLVIATLQIKDLLGLTVAGAPQHFLDRVAGLARALPTLRWQDAALGGVTLALLLVWPRVSRKVPAPLVALAASAGIAAVLTHLVPGFSVATIASRFSYVLDGVTHAGIPRLPPLPVLPWRLPGGDGKPLGLTFDLVRELLPAAFAIAMLGAIESLLSAVVAEGMTGEKHDPDSELVAQGAGNLLAPFFGGIAATGAIARTATNIRSGARSPLAAVFHSLVVLAAVLALAPLLGFLPMASLAALLLVVAWNMSEARYVVRTLREAPKSDAFILVTCLTLTVVFDMVVAVTVGIVLASLLFMRRMAEVSEVTLVEPPSRGAAQPPPAGVLVYRLAGPLFFGAAQKAVAALQRVEKGVRVVVLDLRAVPALDATALVGLGAAVARLRRERILVILAGVQRQPLRALAKAGWRNEPGALAIGRSFEESLDTAYAAAATPLDS
jgi:SulP family sulfate permease